MPKRRAAIITDSDVDESSPSGDDVGIDILIATRGDLILLVGESRRRIRVHSEVMHEGSSVFHVLLGSRPNASPREANKRPIELSLPDDNAGTIALLCNILHCATTLKHTPSSREILALAKAARKYNALPRAVFTAEVWIEKLSGFQNSELLWDLLLAAYEMDLDGSFDKVSRQLLLMHSGSFRELVGYVARNCLAADL
ncbi:hypothetical protein HRG_001069 [Hirsutella rhossiliensis]|uniref:BTB domain-containing protein n=1 Tax=Hirsutella rhossiliensis TaxID=111463 RepID=A0A9P8NC39_9HYPO|nr:uncharacterized protein HRG_01069 [Hirsutella rhossiliensis]KAH0968427.1 hypothetical protein HRG_01069 [Hirsutella rhossiliensis]